MSQTSNDDKPDPLTERVWEEGWEGHERLQRERMARLTLAQKLEWLEEAQRVAEHLARRIRTTDEDCGKKALRD